MSNSRIFCVGAFVGMSLGTLMTFIFGDPKYPWAGLDLAIRVGIIAVAFFGDRARKPKTEGISL